MNKISTLWYSRSEADWKNALNSYWQHVKPKNLELERYLNKLKLEEIKRFDQKGWYDFLHDRYFQWKYTTSYRYVTTTRELKKYLDREELDKLFSIKLELLNLNTSDIKTGLQVAKQIRGLGFAGASGLLSLLYPHSFATVDQFVVKALRLIYDLPENQILCKMNPDDISLNDGVILINIMRRKAKENNDTFHSNSWTPRKIDMVLWGARE